MTQADTLSRRSNYYQKEDRDNENIILLPEGLFVNLLDTELQDQILKAHNIDHNVLEVLDQIFEQRYLQLIERLG